MQAANSIIPSLRHDHLDRRTAIPLSCGMDQRSYPNIQAQSLRSLDLQRADDRTIFDAAKHNTI